jgi:hypothetical protein
MKHGDPLNGLLFVLAHYWTFLGTITWTPNYVFLSYLNDTHIVGFMNEVILSFDHLSTQLALVRLRVKVSKCILWNPSRIFLGVEIPQGCILVIDDLCILGV